MADNYVAKDGAGALQTFAAKLVTGVFYPLHIMQGLVGGSGANQALNVDAAGNVSVLPPQAAVTETTVAMTGLWVKVWTAAPAKRLVIGLASDSGASGDFSFRAALSGSSTSGGLPFAVGSGGSWDFAGGAIPNTDLYVKATSGSSLTVQAYS